MCSFCQDFLTHGPCKNFFAIHFSHEFEFGLSIQRRGRAFVATDSLWRLYYESAVRSHL